MIGLEFVSVTMKNFQAVGNTPITIELNRSPTTMISGKNGSGKSNVLEALSYGWFNKLMKDVNLSNIINTTNKKNLVVEVVAKRNGKVGKVVRGQKPGKLEFYIDGELQDQNASSKDYQAKIEKFLGMDFRLFTQLFVLNREKYKPFMELDAASRRKVVEDILDISVFSVMGEMLKKETEGLPNQISQMKSTRDRLVEKINGQKRLIENEKENDSNKVKLIEDEIIIIQSEIDNIAIALADEETKLDNTLSSKISELTKKKSDFERVAIQFNSKIKSIEDNVSFFKVNTTCPTCDQDISQAIKDLKINESNDKVNEVKSNVQKMVPHLKVIVDSLKELQDKYNEEAALRQGIKSKRDLIDHTKRNLQRKQNELQNELVAQAKVSKVNQYKDELVTLEADLEKATEDLQTLLASEQDYNRCKILLKDDCIKATIVKDYIDFINKRLNEYMNSMEFFLNITLDESFNDKVNSINREGFTYGNLSTGQKSRVNLAIWFALIEVATMKNSVVSNLLILDEILENMDSDGVQLFMNLVENKLGHKNVFVITQRSEEFSEHFRSEIKFKLNEGFTEIVK